MCKDFNFTLSFSLATIILLGLVFIGIVDSLTVVIVSVVIVLAFGLYNFLVRKEFFKLKKEISYLIEKNVKSLNKSDNTSIIITTSTLLERYKEVIKNYRVGKIDNIYSLAELRSIKLELVKIFELHYVLVSFVEEITEYGDVVRGNNKLNSNTYVHDCLNKMFQCYEIADKIISKMDQKRLSLVPYLQSIFYKNRNLINIVRVCN